MEVLDQMLNDVRNLYSQVIGRPYTRSERLEPLPLPKEVDPLAYLYSEIAHLKNLLVSKATGATAYTLAWIPVMDVSETAGEIFIRVELPGVTKSDIALTLGENLLVIKGERKPPTLEQGERILARERFYGMFERWIPLPTRVKPDNIDARFNEGILEIRLSKVSITEVHGQRIEVK